LCCAWCELFQEKQETPFRRLSSCKLEVFLMQSE
jgi:hypothetical protein